MAPQPYLLKIPAAAKYLGIGRSKLYELIAAGEIETIHIGRSVRVSTEVLEAYAAQAVGCRKREATAPQ